MADEPSSLPSPRSEGYSPVQHIGDASAPFINGDRHAGSPDVPGDKERVERGSVEPPKNAEGKLICTHDKPMAKCAELTFDRKCEWRKHMDKHERPFRCNEPSCAGFRGFTYQGGLLRHEREVHKKFGGPKELLNCPIPYCKRNTGVGFTRKENLNEHVRRVHRIEPLDTESAVTDPAILSPSAAIPPVTAQFAAEVVQSSLQASSPQRGRKRKQASVASENIYNGGEAMEAQEEVKRLRLENMQKDDEISKLQTMLREKEQQMHLLMQNFSAAPHPNHGRQVSPSQ